MHAPSQEVAAPGETPRQLGRRHPHGNRQTRSALSKAVRCLKKRSKIPAGVRAKIFPIRRLDFVAASIGLVVEGTGHQRPIRFGELLAEWGPLAA